MFDNLKLLAPESLEEVDKKVEELKEREAMFERACMEEASESDLKTIKEIKGEKEEQKEIKEEKTEEFPVLA